MTHPDDSDPQFDSPNTLSPVPRSAMSSVSLRVRMLALMLLLLRLPVLDHPKPVHPDELEFIEAIGFPTPYPVHPPGYPAWVAFGTGVAKVARGPYQAFQIGAAIGASVAAVFLYLILRRWVCTDATAWLLAFAFGVNPLVWFLSVTALNYTAAAAAALAVVYFLLRAAAEGAARDLRIGTAFLAVGLFLRPDLLLWLGPLWLVLALRHPVRVWLPASGVLALSAGASWYLTQSLYGGTEIGRAALAHTRAVIWNTSVFHQGLHNGLARNAVKLVVNLLWDFGPVSLVIPLAWIAARRAIRRSRAEPSIGDAEAARPHVTSLIVLATMPLILFTLVIHMSEPGHILLLIPAGYALLGAGLANWTPQRAKQAAAVVAVVAAAQFWLYPWSPDSTGWKRTLDAKIGYLSAAGLRQIDRRAEIHTPGDFWPTGRGD